MRLIDADALPISFDGHTVSVWKKDLDAAPTINQYEWISVEDRLPDELFMAVLIYCPDKDNIYCAYLNARNEWHIFDQGSGLWVLERVTHWMPLPSPPTEKEN